LRDHLATLLDDFRRFDHQIAVVRYQGNRRRVTRYGEIARLAGRFAALLKQREIGPGDRVLLWAENSAEWIAAFYGCMLRGVLAVPLDANGTADFAARVCADVQPKLAVGDELLVGQLQAEWPRLTFEEWLTVLPAEEAAPVSGLSRETPLEILFTSGTTGDPKGVVITHGNILASVGPIEDGAQPYLRYEKLIHPLRILHTLPLSHVFGQTMGLWVPPIFPAEIHFESRLVAPELIETIHRERISVLAAVPRVLALIKNHLEATRPGLRERLADSEDIRAWRRWLRFRKIHSEFGFKFWAVVSGGGSLTGPLEEFWNRLGLVVIQGYGLTESTALITLNHPFHVAKGTIGKPMPGREVKLGPDGEVLVRGAMISGATWSDGAMKPRRGEWLATGDLVEEQSSGDLRFVGRKSETIVTAAGVNVHPEDLEAAIEQEPGIAACAVVPMETTMGTEPCAVLACRGAGEQAAAAIENANTQLAEFQRLSHWVLWPELDLPRASTGKILRKEVEAWLARIQAAATTPCMGTLDAGSTGTFGASADWLLALIAQITDETPAKVGDELRLTEDLHLDSLGRVQLAAAIEERLGTRIGNELLDRVETLGELRSLLAGDKDGSWSHTLSAQNSETNEAPSVGGEQAAGQPEGGAGFNAATARYSYPHWPWAKPVLWIRTAFIEAGLRPLVWLLANPRVTVPEKLDDGAPMLIVANHVTAFDGPLVEYALPESIRRRMAVAMAAEMLDDYRHFRNPKHAQQQKRFDLFGPLKYLLLTALFNVFPLPRKQNFQRSFAHAGKALDRGFNVLVFPEGTRSQEGELARFRGGIGLLTKESDVAVLPVALCGLGEVKTRRRRWLRPGTLEVRVGEPIRFSPAETEAGITARLHDEVEKLMKG
jgi:long-chain acyl-CoA synthetase